MTRPDPTLPLARYRELDETTVNVELHMHTRWTDGQGTVREVLERARERGLRTVAFTEHVRRSTDWFSAFADEVRSEALRVPELRVLVGCEAKALDEQGDLDASPAVLAECDLVLGSVHRFPDAGGRPVEFAGLSAEHVAQREQELALGLLRHAPIHVLAHPGGMYQRRFGAYPEPLFRALLEASLERGVAVEISSSYLRDLPAFLRLCEEVNPRVSVGSDVHRLDHVGACRDALRAERGEVEHSAAPEGAPA